MNIVFMSMDTLPSTLWARDLYDQMHIRSDFRKWFPRMCQYGFIEGRDYEYMPRVRLQDEGGRTVQRYVKDYRITQDMAKKLCKLHHTVVGAAYHPQQFDWDALLGLLHKKPPRRSSYGSAVERFGFAGYDHADRQRVRLRSQGVQSAAASARHPVPGQRPVGAVFGTPRQGLYVQPDVPAPAQRWLRGGKAAHGMDAERPEVPLPHFEAARCATAG